MTRSPPRNPSHLRPPHTSLKRFLHYYAEDKKQRNEKVFCFQIGANDGKSRDPVHPYFSAYGWHGLLVEPQKDVFENELLKTYAGNQRVILENVALGSIEGRQPFYRISFSHARWATGLSSFHRQNIENHIASGYVLRQAQETGDHIPPHEEDWIETVQIPTTTVAALLKKHEVHHANVICIDTEGYDYELLKLIDFQKLAPEVVFFESKNLSDDDFVAAQKLLKGFGYRLFWEKGNTLAIKYAYPLLRRWQDWLHVTARNVRRSLRKTRS